MQYQPFGSPFPILRLAPRKWINDASDPDYAAYQAWLAAGGQPVSKATAADIPAVEQLAVSDYHMARIGEDVLNALVAKGAMKLTDLPAITQQIIAERQALRAKLATE